MAIKTNRKKNPLCELLDAGQSVWMDTISRQMIQDGSLKRLIKEDGIRGVTSNPDIFQKAISGSNLYDDQIRKLALAGKSVTEIYEALAVDDIRKAADVLRPVYDQSGGVDGLISLEVSPYLAFDQRGTVEEAHRLWAAVNKPNVFIKVPATPPGVAAIRQLIADGININVTLIFSLEAYQDVMEAYISGLEDRVKAKKPINGIVSVASFFISRIDVLVDKLLGTRITALTPKADMPTYESAISGESVVEATSPTLLVPQNLLGKGAIASAKIAYQQFKQNFHSKRFDALKSKGAKVQRPLWASTSSKNPLYPDTVYVAPLIGPDTVNTMPMTTIDAWRAKGVVRKNTIEEGIEESQLILEQLARYGIDLISATWQVMEEGVSKFNQPFDKLLSSIAEKRAALVGFKPQKELLGKYAKQVQGVADSLSEAQLNARLWRRDTSLWPGDDEVAEKISSRLGWLYAPNIFQSQVNTVVSFAQEVRKAGFKHVVLLGMGGSSLCPEVCAKTFGSKKGYPGMVVLDTTSPDAIRAAEKTIDVRKAIFIPASKSGSTIETNSLFHYFWDRLEKAGIKKPGDHFIAITDPDTSLGALAKARGFRRTFINPPDIGGRFSALSFFGLVPMALIGIDVKNVLDRAVAFARDSESLVPVMADPAARLGVIMATLAQTGRDKLTLITSPGLASLGIWIEQLVAESTGKESQGVLPVDGEKPGAAAAYGKDRLFVVIQLEGEKIDEKKVAALESAGQPVIRIALRDALDLGAEFLRWEIATAVAGAVLKVNPFDEPNVTESKKNTSDLLKEFKSSGKLPMPKEAAAAKGVTLSLSKAAQGTLARAGAKPESALRDLVQGVGEGGYISLLAFIEQNTKNAARLSAIRNSLRDKTLKATTVGFGPRYLHSTGQLHKGGPDNGLFIMVMSEPKDDLAIPGQDYSFRTLIQAQALGDFRSLEVHERKAVLVNVGSDVERGLQQLAAWLGVKA